MKRCIVVKFYLFVANKKKENEENNNILQIAK